MPFSFSRQLLRAAPRVDVRRTPWPNYAAAAAAVGTITVLGVPLLGHLDLANIVMLFPLGVLFAGIKLGRGPAVLAAFLSVLLFDVFFVPPRFTLGVSDLQYLLTFAVLLIVALITAQLATGLKHERDSAEAREQQAQALYGMARELSAALTVEQIADMAGRFAQEAFESRMLLLVPDLEGRLVAFAESLAGPEETGFPAHIAARVYQSGEPEEDSATGARYVPLKGPMRVRGVLGLLPGRAPVPTAAQMQLLDTLASLLGIALERIHFVSVASQTELAIESERLRNSLLAALSHDLRTPITAIAGLADTIVLTPPALAREHAELVESIRMEALRTGALVNNLLDMARFESGGIHLQREWLPIEEVVGSALQAVASLLTAHKLVLDIPPELPMIEIDGVLMERVVCNMLENAAKYTPPGSVIQISARADSEWLALTVCDNGPGLPPGKAEDLFAKFVRGRAESNVSGVGLGLAIVSTIVKAHGGRLRASNRPEGGACFVISLRLGTPPEYPVDSP